VSSCGVSARLIDPLFQDIKLRGSVFLNQVAASPGVSTSIFLISPLLCCLSMVIFFPFSHWLNGNILSVVFSLAARRRSPLDHSVDSCSLWCQRTGRFPYLSTPLFFLLFFAHRHCRLLSVLLQVAITGMSPTLIRTTDFSSSVSFGTFLDHFSNFFFSFPFLFFWTPGQNFPPSSAQSCGAR